MNIAVYCSSRAGLPQQYEDVARAAGRWIGEQGHTLVYGGVNAGLMHTVAQACHDAGGRIVGVVPDKFAARTDSIVDEVISTHDLADRKDVMTRMSDLFVVLPGGIGTIDEWISTLSQIMVNEGDSRGIVAVNIDHLFDHQVEALKVIAHSPFARGHHIDMTAVVTNSDQLINYLTQYQLNYGKK